MYQETRFAAADPVAPPDKTALVIGAGAILVIAGLFLAPPLPWFTSPELPSSTLKVETATGHGSGVHIGDGLVLTAAHVASDGVAVRLKADDGTIRDATVVWSSKGHDIALLRTSPDGLSASPMSCAPVVKGQAITARGNPLTLEFITTYGHIVGDAAPVGDWLSAAPVDMTILPGMSGGPAFNASGEVVGISVAVLTAQLGYGASFTGIGMIVPAVTICGLLGR